MAVSVAVAVGDIGNQLVEKIKNKAEVLKVAPWTDSSAEMGPVISKEHKKDRKLYRHCINEGADLKLDGRQPKYRAMKMGILLVLHSLIMSKKI